MGTRTQISLAADSVVTNLFQTEPKILLIKRKHFPFQGKLCLPGGHFDAGIWNETKKKFVANEKVNCDESLEVTASRELVEETNIEVNSKDWQFLMHLDNPSRDPRSDSRRLSIVFWYDAHSDKIFDQALAGDDASECKVVNLNSLRKTDMGFDHWLVIEQLQNIWNKHFQN